MPIIFSCSLLTLIRSLPVDLFLLSLCYHLLISTFLSPLFSSTQGRYIVQLLTQWQYNMPLEDYAILIYFVHSGKG